MKHTIEFIFIVVVVVVEVGVTDIVEVFSTDIMLIAILNKKNIKIRH